MVHHFSIGATPWGEDCVQVGCEGYEARALVECEAFRKQLLRTAATAGKTDFPVGFRLEVKGHPHDFGTYYEVGATYDDENEESVKLAVWFSDESPEEWDAESRIELGLSEIAG